MSELKPCPACGGTCSTQAESPREVYVWCMDCDWPMAKTEAEAIARHNDLPREERWVPVSEGLPEPSDQLFDVAATKEGKRFVVEMLTRSIDSWEMGKTVRVLSDKYGGVTHYRMHTPPRGPEES